MTSTDKIIAPGRSDKVELFIKEKGKDEYTKLEALEFNFDDVLEFNPEEITTKIIKNFSLHPIQETFKINLTREGRKVVEKILRREKRREMRKRFLINTIIQTWRDEFYNYFDMEAYYEAKNNILKKL